MGSFASSNKRARIECQVLSQCQIVGCNRLTEETTRGVHRKFCSRMHRDLHMEYLANIFDGGQGEDEPLEEYVCNGVCKLPQCGRACWKDPSSQQLEDFCGICHVLEYIKICTRRWKAKGRLCQFQPCRHHVSVDEVAQKCYDFCGLEHAMCASAGKGLSESLDPESVVYETTKTDKCQAPPQSIPPDLNNRVRGYHAKIMDSELEASLQAAIRNLAFESATDKPYSKLAMGINIIEHHPWDIVTEFEGFTPRYFLHIFKDDGFQCRKKKGKAQSPGQRKTTFDGFGWKQTSKTHRKHNLETTYFWYELKEKTTKDAKERNSVSDIDYVRVYRNCPATSKKTPKRWRMHEIVLSESAMDAVQMSASNDQVTEFPKAVIWKIFQDLRGEPVWPPIATPSVPLAVRESVFDELDIIGHGNSTQLSSGPSDTISMFAQTSTPVWDMIPEGTGTSQDENITEIDKFTSTSMSSLVTRPADSPPLDFFREVENDFPPFLRDAEILLHCPLTEDHFPACSSNAENIYEATAIPASESGLTENQCDDLLFDLLSNNYRKSSSY